MYAWNLEKERAAAESYLLHRQTDFTTTYMEVSNLQYIIAQQPEIVKPATADALCCVLGSTAHIQQRQIFFLFKKAADALADMLRQATPDIAAKQAQAVLADSLVARSGHALRAAAEAMGAMPLTGKFLPSPDTRSSSPGVRLIHDLPAFAGTRVSGKMKWMGRSLVIRLPEETGRMLVFKFARPGQQISDLAAEARWMHYLSGLTNEQESGFDIPELFINKSPVIYRLRASALKIPDEIDIDPKRHAIAFKVRRSYFRYPNHPEDGNMLPKEEYRAVLSQNARILGKLASRGIIHTAPIPLFHNRVQRHRRQDHGLYQWHRGGRLDQWLASCRYPNICKTGIRDFEHFISFDGPARGLYQHIGSHVFSLALLAGSYCRNHDENRIGLDAQGQPVDARDLFDRDWLKSLMADIFANYYEGFTGNRFSGSPPRDLDLLSSRMIEEMGVDKHMEEILRVAEQEAMNMDEFSNFLRQRGFSKEAVKDFKKGEQDIRIMTGPHLGGFNERISVPELIEYTAALSALCIMDRFCGQRFNN